MAEYKFLVSLVYIVFRGVESKSSGIQTAETPRHSKLKMERMHRFIFNDPFFESHSILMDPSHCCAACYLSSRLEGEIAVIISGLAFGHWFSNIAGDV